ncbi:MAG TPA: DnaB-like helicase C-terminal domain-containing protein [Mycobacterium sp.]|jgi:replicative DNA helicase|uniref:replicative DNA helicase n=1 Tax=Mycobacterium sp. TaxID=1785 RepID=UPI002F407905
MSGEGDWDITADPGLLASERVVAGAAVQSARAAGELALTLAPEHFRDHSCAAAYAAALRLAEAGDPVDPASVLGELSRTRMLARIGGTDAGTGGAFLHTLIASAVASAEKLRDGLDAGTAWHARKIRQEADRLRLAETARRCFTIASGPGYDPEVHPDEIRSLIDAATTGGGIQPLLSQAELLAEVLERLESEPNPGLPTGIADLDAVIGGLRPGELIVVGGRPSMGKSILGLEFAEHASARLGLPVLLASLEMSKEEVMHRRIARRAKVSLERLTRHSLEESDWQKVNAAHAVLAGSPLLIDDRAEQSLTHIRGRLRAMERAGAAARLVVIDYLGLMAKPNAESHQVSVAALSAGAKRLAREQEIPVVLVAQLNRMPEGRSDKRPALADLRDSGQIEADADMVLLVHRDDYYDPETRAGEVDVIVAKQRQGQRVTVPLSFQGHYSRIADMHRRWTPASSLGETA